MSASVSPGGPTEGPTLRQSTSPITSAVVKQQLTERWTCPFGSTPPGRLCALTWMNWDWSPRVTFWLPTTNSCCPPDGGSLTSGAGAGRSLMKEPSEELSVLLSAPAALAAVGATTTSAMPMASTNKLNRLMWCPSYRWSEWMSVAKPSYG